MGFSERFIRTNEIIEKADAGETLSMEDISLLYSLPANSPEAFLLRCAGKRWNNAGDSTRPSRPGSSPCTGSWSGGRRWWARPTRPWRPIPARISAGQSAGTTLGISADIRSWTALGEA